jgi:hypothetical protein
MKRIKLITIASVTLTALFIACVAHKQAPYELPEAMLPYVKVEYAKRCEQGYALYNMSCAKCHTKVVKGKKIIPDFTPAQLTGYTLRVSNAQHEQNMPDSIVTEEELGIIMTFLSYKKKNPAR